VIFTRNRRCTIFFIALIFSSSAVSVAFFSRPPWRPSDFVVRHWQKQLATLPDKKILSQLRRIGQLGDAATPVLVKALASQRSQVVEASYQVLNESLDAWQLLRSRDSSPLVFQLTDELYRQFPNFGPSAKPLVRDMVLRALLWPMDETRINRTELVRKCEYLMVASVRQAESSTERDILVTPKASLANGLGPPWQKLERPASLVSLPTTSLTPESQFLPVADKPGR